MSNKGITLITVVMIIVVMILIATVSIVAGNEIILKSNQYKREQELETVKEAVSRRKSEIDMSGTIIPIGESYVGAINPIICSDSRGTVTAKNWYLLDEDSLENLGVYDAENRYLVNYEYGIVLSTFDSSYIEEYCVIACLLNNIEANTTIGKKLGDKTEENPEATIVVNNEDNEIFGNGWYLVHKEDFTENAAYINSDYVLNYKNAEYVKVTDYKEV